jgi:hypothetical protein
MQALPYLHKRHKNQCDWTPPIFVERELHATDSKKVSISSCCITQILVFKPGRKHFPITCWGISRIINPNTCTFHHQLLINIECWGISDITCIRLTRESHNNNGCILQRSEATYHLFHYEFLESLIRLYGILKKFAMTLKGTITS